MKKFRFLLAAAAIVFIVACSPVSSYQTIPTAEQPIIPGARMGFSEFQTDLKTYYETLGEDGPPILLIHGIGGGSSLFQYRKNAQAFVDAGYKVYAIDLLGFGRSTRPVGRYTQLLLTKQIESFIRSEIGQPSVVVANGVAGAYTVRIAAEQPELISKMILVGPTGISRQTRPQNQDRIDQYELISFFGPLVYGLFTTSFGQKFFLDQAYYSDASYTQEVVETYDFNLKAPNAEWVVYSFATGSLDDDIGAVWPAVKQPTLLLWGEVGGYTDKADAEGFLNLRTGVESAVLPLSRLLPNEDNPEVFNQTVINFLASR